MCDHKMTRYTHGGIFKQTESSRRGGEHFVNVSNFKLIDVVTFLRSGRVSVPPRSAATDWSGAETATGQQQMLPLSSSLLAFTEPSQANDKAGNSNSAIASFNMCCPFAYVRATNCVANLFTLVLCPMPAPYASASRLVSLIARNPRLCVRNWDSASYNQRSSDRDTRLLRHSPTD